LRDCGECRVLVDERGLEEAVEQVISMHHFAIRCHDGILPLQWLNQKGFRMPDLLGDWGAKMSL
jgi:hypothetical protein